MQTIACRAAVTAGAAELCTLASTAPRCEAIWYATLGAKAAPTFSETLQQLVPQLSDAVQPPPIQSPSTAAMSAPQLRFDDPSVAFASKTTFELLRSLAVMSTCRVRAIVDNADMLLATSKRVLGSYAVNALIRHTAYAHFCAGEDADGIQPVVGKLHAHGIGSILDYAAEDDAAAQHGAASRRPQRAINTVVARTYDYTTEQACDRHARTFEKAIDAAAQSPGRGFAAVKVTALGNPKLLQRLSVLQKEVANLFAALDKDNNGFISKEEFFQAYNELFIPADHEQLSHMYRYLDSAEDGMVDYLSFTEQLRINDIPRIVQRCLVQGPLYKASLDEEEMELVSHMQTRLSRIAQRAAEKRVRLLIDAEQTTVQPAIDFLAQQLMRKYNVHEPVIFNTYQAYLKDCGMRLQHDIQRAQRKGFKFGAKLVRGAYMVYERKLAQTNLQPSPVCDTIEDTHVSYDRCAEELLHECASGRAAVMFATHNQSSIERVAAIMQQLQLRPADAEVYFGQLLGMADNLSFVLGAQHYRVYKYVPFGPVDMVMPYLIRRAQENSAVMAGAASEIAMLRSELFRRLFHTKPPRAIAHA